VPEHFGNPPDHQHIVGCGGLYLAAPKVSAADERLQLPIPQHWHGQCPVLTGRELKLPSTPKASAGERRYQSETSLEESNHRGISADAMRSWH